MIFLFEGNAHRWWNVEKRTKQHTWAYFNTTFHNQYCSPTLTLKRWEFEQLIQGTMYVSDYEHIFWVLDEFFPTLITDKEMIIQRFVDVFNWEIFINIIEGAYTTYQAMRDTTLAITARHRCLNRGKLGHNFRHCKQHPPLTIR